MKPVRHFGIDIDKAALTVACHQVPGQTRRIGNDPPAIDAWLDELPPRSVLAVEASGACHQTLLQRAVAKGAIYLLNPRDVRHYAESLRRRAKTDRVDAQVIARYLEREQDHLRRYTAPEEHAASLEWLLRRRALLVRQQGSLRLGFQDAPLPAIDALLAQYKAALAQIDRLIDEQVAADRARQQQRELLRTIPGVGALSSAALLSLFWRLPGIGAEALIAYIGLDPRPRESGSYRGTRKLSKRGEAEFRRRLTWRRPPSLGIRSAKHSTRATARADSVPPPSS
ncbi:transposase [Luteibacter flocculans]|uniref:Transposase n=1 Tax=Luteibacter flocculans TaxID=2780091 RepID=A0ABY4T7Y5_9GAMM|nr:transposase [Luteibacter flocculans]URL60043.1 transposase [Luteibacter flocculans]